MDHNKFGFSLGVIPNNWSYNKHLCANIKTLRPHRDCIVQEGGTNFGLKGLTEPRDSNQGICFKCWRHQVPKYPDIIAWKTVVQIRQALNKKATLKFAGDHQPSEGVYSGQMKQKSNCLDIKITTTYEGKGWGF